MKLKIGDEVQFEAGHFSHVGIITEFTTKGHVIVKELDNTKWPIKIDNIKRVFDMTFEEEQALFTAQDLIITLQTFVDKIQKIKRTCVDCDHFAKSTYHCSFYNAQVPAETILVGCDSFSNEVPF